MTKNLMDLDKKIIKHYLRSAVVTKQNKKPLEEARAKVMINSYYAECLHHQKKNDYPSGKKMGRKSKKVGYMVGQVKGY